MTKQSAKRRKLYFRAFGLMLKTHPKRDEILNLITKANDFERNRNMPIPPNVEDTSIDKEQLSRLKNLDIVAFNGLAEDLFIILTKVFILEEGPQLAAAICAEAAFELDISIETAKRYLLKHTARRAEFQIKDKTVSLRRGGQRVKRTFNFWGGLSVNAFADHPKER